MYIFTFLKQLSSFAEENPFMAILSFVVGTFGTFLLATWMEAIITAICHRIVHGVTPVQYHENKEEKQ